MATTLRDAFSPLNFFGVVGADIAGVILRYSDRPGILASRVASSQWKQLCASSGVMQGNSAFPDFHGNYSFPKYLAQANVFGQALTTFKYQIKGDQYEGPDADDLALILGRCPFLTDLSLFDRTEIADDFIDAIAEAGCLQSLLVEGYAYDPASPEPFLVLLRSCNQLTSLDLSFDYVGSEFASMPSIFVACPKLKHLGIGHALEEVITPFINEPHPSLSSLYVLCVSLTDTHLEDIATHLEGTLEELDLPYSLHDILPQSVTRIVARLTKLKCLTFQGIDEEHWSDIWENDHWRASKNEHWQAAQKLIKSRLSRNAQISSTGVVRYVGISDADERNHVEIEYEEGDLEYAMLPAEI